MVAYTQICKELDTHAMDDKCNIFDGNTFWLTFVSIDDSLHEYNISIYPKKINWKEDRVNNTKKWRVPNVVQSVTQPNQTQIMKISTQDFFNTQNNAEILRNTTIDKQHIFVPFSQTFVGTKTTSFRIAKAENCTSEKKHEHIKTFSTFALLESALRSRRESRVFSTGNCSFGFSGAP